MSSQTDFSIGLFSIPNELLVAVLKLLDINTLNAFQSTCRYSNAIVRDTSALFYPVVLSRSGMVDNQGTDMSLVERCQKLLMYEQAWRELRWSVTSRIDISSVSAHGHWHQQLENPGSMLVIFQGALDTNLSRLSMHQYPSNTRGIVEESWSVALPSPSVLAFAFDFEQDLCVAQLPAGPIDGTAIDYAFLSLSTGHWHPDAAQVDYGATLSPALAPITYGDYIISPQFPVHSRNDIWNWKTGERLAIIACHFTAITFIDRSHIMVSARAYAHHGPALLIYRLSSLVTDEGGQIQVPPISALGLPSFKEDIGLLQCNVRSSLCNPHNNVGSFGSEVPFKTDAADGGIVLAGLVDDRDLSFYEFAFLTKSLLKLLDKRPSSADEFIPWALWGPSMTHYTFEKEPVTQRVAGRHDFQLCGTRRVASRPVRRDDGTLVAHVVDYHPRRVAYSTALPPSTKWSIQSGGAGNQVYDADIWEQSPGSRLSYIQSETVLPEELQHHEPQDIVLSIHEDGLTACMDFSPMPRRLHTMAF